MYLIIITVLPTQIYPTTTHLSLDSSTYLHTLMANIEHNLINDLDKILLQECYLCSPESCKSILTREEENLKILTQNIRSADCNFSAFEVLLKRIGIEHDIIILTETWNKNKTTFPSLLNYDTYSTFNNKNQNDGIILLIKSSLNYSIDEPIFRDGTCLLIKLNPDTLIVSIYRSPYIKNVTIFLNSLDKLLREYRQWKNVILMGDINIDIKSDSIDKNCNDYLNLLATHGFLTGHTFPTRERNCLDHAMIRSTHTARIAVMEAPLTDHAAVALYLSNVPKNYNVKKPTINKVNLEAAALEICNTDFTDIFKSTNANWSANKLVTTMSNIIHTHTTTINLPRSHRNFKPWITPGLIKCMRKRDQMHLKTKKAPKNTELKAKYQNYRNVCNDLLKYLKQTHERMELKKHNKDPKRLWKTIKNITNTETQKSPPTELLNIKECPEKSLDYINDYFSNVGKKLASQINSLNGNLCNKQTNTLNNSSVNSMTMLPTDSSEVEAILLNLKDDCAIGWDNISAKILKLCKSSLIPVLTHIFNISIDTGIFPLVFKRAVVHPVHKAGDRDRVENYRPISVLSALSKIFEKIINKRLLSYLENNQFLSNHQFGFRAGKSTEDAVTGLTKYVMENLDDKKKCIGVFLDLAKAFDTVSIPKLIQKLEMMGVRGVILKLFKDYLTNRTQRIKIGSYCSSDAPITFGVPQGSVLGPSLFLVYINDICNTKFEQGKVFTFADDTALIFCANSWEEAKANAEMGLGTVIHHLNNSLLTLNVQKTKFITFAMTCRTIPKDTDISIRAHKCDNIDLCNPVCDCGVLERTKTIKYLGVLLDERLSWKPHINALCGRVRRLIHIMKKLRPVADFALLRNTYYALAQSLLQYCITSWGGSPLTSMLLLERAQRAVLKVMLFKPYFFATSELYSLCGVLTVRQLFIKATVLRQHLNQPYTPNLRKRRKDRVCTIKSHRTTFMQRSTCFLGPYLYNKINKEIDLFPLNYSKCKFKLNTWLQKLTYKDTEALISIQK